LIVGMVTVARWSERGQNRIPFIHLIARSSWWEPIEEQIGQIEITALNVRQKRRTKARNYQWRNSITMLRCFFVAADAMDAMDAMDDRVRY